MYTYPKETYVKIDRDTNSNKRYRLTLDRSMTAKRRVLMIFMNPSKADTIISDRTINNAYKYFIESGNTEFEEYDGIEVLNLIPYYETISSKLREIPILICEHNNMCLARSCIEDRIIILAYGNAPTGLTASYRDQIAFLLSELEGRTVYHVDDLLKNGNPRHACYWQLYMKLHEAKIQDKKILSV